MEEEQPAAAPIVGEELPGEAELQLAVAQEPGALEEAVEAPSPARGAVIMSRGIRTRDGDSLLVRFVNHEGWLEARALDCSGGKVGRIVLCGIADDDAAAQRRLCEELAPRLIVRDGTLALGDAPRPADEGSVADSVQLAEAPAPAPLVEAPAPAPDAAAPAPAQGGVYVDPATGVSYAADYVVGPPPDPDDLRQKMRDDFLLLMRAQTLLPAPTKALLKFYAKAWDEAPPAHWSDVIRGLCDEGLVQATRDAAGEPVEVWF